MPRGHGADDDLAGTAYGTYANLGYSMVPPGTFWNYSNTNFILAGLISEELDTRMWPDIMLEDVFQPLGMTRTFLRKAEVEADGDYALSFGLGVSTLTTEEVDFVPMSDVPDSAFARPAGLVWTTPTQLTTWADFMMHGNPAVLSDPLRQQITEPHVDTLMLSPHEQYGFGMFVRDGYLSEDGNWYSMPIWEHAGGTQSFTNQLYMLPDRDFVVVITASGRHADLTHSVDAALTTLVDLPAPSDPPTHTVDPSTFDRHVATYTDPYNVGDMIITRQGGKLWIEMPLLDQYGYDVEPEMVALSSEIFFVYINGYPYNLTFIATSSGGDSVYVRNRAFVCKRGKTKAGGPVPSAEDVASWFERTRLLQPLSRWHE